MRTIHFVALAALLASACGASGDSASEPIVVDDTASNGDEAPTSSGDEAPASEGRLVIGEDACTSDADCVPADCCHASACVARGHAPDCADAVCTTECRYGTIDCGGGCLCHEGRCAARLSEAPDLNVQ